jgi:hypothetical protein
VAKKLIPLKIDEIPAKCKLKIAQLTPHPEWDKREESGG